MADWQEIREKALVAIEEGRLSVEELLAIAQSSPSFRKHLAAELRKARERPKRRLQVRTVHWKGQAKRAKELVTEATEQLRRDYKWFSRDKVTIGWGAQRRDGARTGETGLIATVSKKRRGLSDQRALPRRLVLGKGSNKTSYRLDVQPEEHIRKQQTKVGYPGNRVTIYVGRPDEGGKRRTGTLSALKREENGRYTAFMSGHVVKRRDVRVEWERDNQAGLLGTATWCRENEWIDAAAVPGVSIGIAKQLSLSEHRVLSPDECQEVVVEVLGTQRAGIQEGTKVEVYPSAATFRQGRMVDLIKLERRVSDPGDSGAPALAGNLLVGFVVGVSDGHTYLLPADRVL